MTHYERLKKKRLGDILVHEDAVTEEVAIAALHEQQRTGRLLSDILIEQRQISDYDLARVIVEQYQAPYIELSGYSVHKDLIEEFPAELLHRTRVVPLDRFGKVVSFACQEIPEEGAAKELRKRASGGMYFYIASAVEIAQVLADYVPYDMPAREDADPAASGAPIAQGDMLDETEWKDIFDAANDSVMTDLTKIVDEES